MTHDEMLLNFHPLLNTYHVFKDNPSKAMALKKEDHVTWFYLKTKKSILCRLNWIVINVLILVKFRQKKNKQKKHNFVLDKNPNNFSHITSHHHV